MSKRGVASIDANAQIGDYFLQSYKGKEMGKFHAWWVTVPVWAKQIVLAAAITAILGALAWFFTKAVPSMIRWFYIRTLLKLDAATKLIRAEQEGRWRRGGIVEVDENVFPIPLERVVRKADISLWRAKRAIQWDELRKKYP